jgi:hypothetical protein
MILMFIYANLQTMGSFLDISCLNAFQNIEVKMSPPRFLALFLQNFAVLDIVKEIIFFKIK